MLDALFAGGKDEVDLSQAGTRLARRSVPFDKALQEELTGRGWVDPDRQARRRRLLAFWILTLVASFGVFVVAVLLLGSALSSGADAVALPSLLAGLGGGALLVGFAGLVYSVSLRTLTAQGEDQAARWKAFRSYLEGVVRGREPAIRPDFFERYLPCAAAFGLGTRWGKFFQKLGGVPLPAWFHAIEGSQADFGAVVAVLAASDSSAASGAGGAGAAGASGGGASGAG
jgi:uncharacterized membrane protein